MWDKRVLEKIDSAVDRFSVSCDWKGVEDGFKWSGTRVYGPTLDSVRIAFWYELTTISNRWTSPWCVFGDFNAIRYPREHWGRTSFNQSVVDFSDFIDGSNLIDLPLEGGLFTWSSGAENPFMSRIDRFLASPDWKEHYPDVRQRLLPRPILDHSPILVDARGMSKGKSAFKFENMWLKTEDFKFGPGMVV